MPKIIIDVTENAYKAMKRMKGSGYYQKLILDGMPLPAATNGEVLMNAFPNNRVDIVMGKVYFFTHDDEDEDFDEFVVFNLNWWNSKWGE